MAGSDNNLVILTAVGPADRPGIIAALTGAVLECSGNLDDATMTRLHGAFATMIAAQVAGDQLHELRRLLDGLAIELGLQITLELLDKAEDGALPADGADHIISVYGADHPGIVHRVAALLAQHDVNITSLNTRLTGETGGRPIYVMALETSGGDWNDLPIALALLGAELGVDVNYSEIDEETL